MVKDYIKNLSVEFKVVFLIASIYTLSYAINYPIGCIIYRITGIDSPGCGMATAWYWLLKGDVSKAFYYHPLFILPLIALILYVVDKKIRKIERINTIYIILALIMVIVYIIRIVFDIDLFIPLDTEFNLFNK